jgi:hypothetical protein
MSIHEYDVQSVNEFKLDEMALLRCLGLGRRSICNISYIFDKLANLHVHDSHTYSLRTS